MHETQIWDKMAVRNRRQRRRRRRRQNIAVNRLVDRENPLEVLPEVEVYRRYRFRPDTILYIVQLIYPFLERQTARSSALPPLFQVLSCLRFLATGGFYTLISDTMKKISPSSVCRSVHAVCSGLCSIARRFIKMPTGQMAEDMKSRFYSIAGKKKSKHMFYLKAIVILVTNMQKYSYVTCLNK